MPRLLKTSVAERDVAEIADYISHDNIDAALRFLDAVEQTCDLLVHWPHLGAAIDNQHIDDLRRMQVKGFPKFLMQACAGSDPFFVFSCSGDFVKVSQ